MIERVVITSYDELRAAVNERRMALRLVMLDLDHCSGVMSGYSAKLLTARRIKSFGEMSLPAVLGALGSRIVVTSGDKRTVIGAEEALVLMKLPGLWHVLGVEVAVEHDDAAIPATTRRMMRGGVRRESLPETALHEAA